MNFGLFMMPLHPPHRSFADSYDRDIDLIVAADKLGYKEAWIGEHITERWENAPCPDLLIAKALALTDQIIFGTGVTLLAIHNPVDLAHRLAMLDHMARGRFYWGIGSRGLSTDLQIFGIDPKQTAEVRERAHEALDVVLKMWESEGKFEYHGKYFDVSAPELDPVLDRGFYMKPYQTPHPPIGVAATSISSDSMRMAGQRGWIPMSSSNLVPQYLRGHWEVVAEGASNAGITPDRSQWHINREVFVAETNDLARERARELLGRNYVEHQRPNRLGSGMMIGSKIDPNMPDDAVDVDYLMENLWIVGGPQECADQIRSLYEEVGGFGTLLNITQDPEDPQWEHDCLRLLIEEVAPKLEDLDLSGAV
jgi:alkanesulfonate monooxygenase SsuD/methylene tetrahydromethanopterin reductase-like flavin-dependent oxidoreductase (luciferase family)